MSKLSVTFAALAVPNFRRQWIASTLATTAFMTTFVLVPIVAYQLTGSYAASGFAAMGNGVGMLFLTPLGGVVADRFPKKPIVLLGQYSTLVVIAGTGVLIATDLITIPLLFASTLLSGATFALTGPARQSWVAELVPGRLVPNAVALQQMGINIAQVLGPTLASVAVVAFGVNAGGVYLGVSLVFLIVVPLNHMLPRTMPKVVQRRSPRRELADGFHYLRRNPSSADPLGLLARDRDLRIRDPDIDARHPRPGVCPLVRRGCADQRHLRDLRVGDQCAPRRLGRWPSGLAAAAWAPPS